MAKKTKSKSKSRPGSHPKPKPKKTDAAAGAKGSRVSKPTRTERLEAASRATQRRSRLVRVGVSAAVALLVLAIAGYLLVQRRAEQQLVAELTSDTCRFDRRSDPGATNEHSPSPTFAVEPPAGGVHTPAVANAGSFTEANTPPDGQLVHGLEHGLVAIWHQPGLAEDEITELRNLANDFRSDVMLIARPGLQTAVAATVWHKRLLCADPEVDQLRRFVTAYRNQGPEKVAR